MDFGWMRSGLTLALVLGLGLAPVSRAQAQQVVVPAAGSNAVRVVDLDAGSVTTSHAVAGDAYGLGVRRDGRRAFAAQVLGARVSAIAIDPASATTVSQPFTMHGAAVSKDGQRLYVAIRDGTEVAVLDAQTLVEETRIGGLSNPAGIHVDPQGRYVAITSHGVPRLTLVGLADGVKRYVPLPGNGGWAMAGSRDGSRLYVQGAGGFVAEVDPVLAGLVRSTTATAAEGGLALAQAVGTLYFASQSGPLERFDADTLAALPPLATGAAALVDVSADGSRVWVGRPSAERLTAYSTAGGSVLADVPVPGITRGMGRFIPTTSGAIALWDLDDDGLGQPGQPALSLDAGLGYTAGAVGRGALDCPGTGPGAQATLDPPGAAEPFAVALWIKPRALPPTASFIGGLTGDGTNGWWLALEGDAVAVIGLTATPMSSTIPLRPGRWQHVAITADASEARLYVDGQLLRSGPRIDAPATGSPFRLCAHPSLTGSRFDGAIDAVAVFRRAITDGEIAGLVAEAPRTAPALPNPGFETATPGAVLNAIEGWRFASYNRDDFGVYGPNPTGQVDARVVTDRRRSGSAALRTFARASGGSGPADANNRRATLVIGLPADLRLSNRAPAIELWRSDPTWTAPSRWYHRLTAFVGDNRSSHEILLYCRAWGLGEGCPNNYFDGAAASMVGADGTAWHRHRIAIPAGLDRDRLWLRIEHQQDAWDWTTAESTLHLDDFGLEPEIAVASAGNDRIQFFGRGADGNVVPTRSIGGPATMLDQPHAVAFSETELFVGNFGGRSIVVFPRDAEGNVAPSRVIAGPATGLAQVTHLRVFGNELFVGAYEGPFLVFAANAHGNVAPKRSLPAMTSVYGVAVDDEELYLSRHPATGDVAIHVYARTANGSTPPLRSIQGSMAFPTGLALTETEVVASDYFDNVVRVFDRSASGPAPALRQFYDPGGLFEPVEVSVRDGEIFVAARASNGVRVYGLDASGPVSARRVIAGPATALAQPVGLTDSLPPARPEPLLVDGFEAP
jgi:DNA-binding beta-propeller fold protein YncE